MKKKRTFKRQHEYIVDRFGEVLDFHGALKFIMKDALIRSDLYDRRSIIAYWKQKNTKFNFISIKL